MKERLDVIFVKLPENPGFRELHEHFIFDELSCDKLIAQLQVRERSVKISFDFDDFFVDTAEMRSWMAMRMHGISIPPQRFKRELVVGGGHLTETQYSQLTLLVSTGNLGLMVEPMEGALKHVALLQNEGHELAIVTSRDGERLETAIKLAEIYRLSLPFYGVGRGKSKASALAGCDVFGDDDNDKLTDLAGVVPHRFLYSHEYNLCEKLDPGIIRISSWLEFHDYIRRLSCEKAAA